MSDLDYRQVLVGVLGVIFVAMSVGACVHKYLSRRAAEERKFDQLAVFI